MGDVLLKLYRMFPWPISFVKIISWLLNSKYCIGVLGVILNERNEILLAHHTYRGKYPWGLPGGMAGRNESPQEAIIREIREEIGIPVKVIRLMDVLYTENSIYLEIAYECAIQQEDAFQQEGYQFRNNAEVSEAKFFPLDRLPTEFIRKEHLNSVSHILELLEHEPVNIFHPGN